MTQELALKVLKTGANVFLTGEPGSGKTHTINEYVRYLHSCGVEPAVTASTGIAATHIGGMTIHSWSGIGVRGALTDYDLDAIEQKEKVVRRVRLAHVLIIDEVSMLSARTLESVEVVCRHLRRSSRPFGGLQVIVVGDFFQLPPVNKRGEPEQHFAYRSAAWTRSNFISCYLHEQHRQEDERFLKTLSAVRRGREVGRARATLLERRVEAPLEGVTKIFPHNVDVDTFNDQQLQLLDGSVRTYFMQGTGAPVIVEALKRSCLSPETLFLKVGAKVMFTKNDVHGTYVNGTQGEVVEFHPVTRNAVVKLHSGRTIEAAPVEWQAADGSRVLAKVTQVPLRLAWAITVHKSQGMSLDRAVIDLSEAFEYGQGYVALSRVRTLAGLFLLGLNEKALQVHPDVSTEDEQFRARSEAAENTFTTMSATELDTLQQNFLRACGGKPGAGPKKSKMDAVREKHTNAYRPWLEEDDALLRNLFGEGGKVASIAREFKRQPGAIRARLVKLGLVQK